MREPLQWVVTLAALGIAVWGLLRPTGSPQSEVAREFESGTPPPSARRTTIIHEVVDAPAALADAGPAGGSGAAIAPGEPAYNPHDDPTRDYLREVGVGRFENDPRSRAWAVPMERSMADSFARAFAGAGLDARFECRSRTCRLLVTAVFAGQLRDHRARLRDWVSDTAGRCEFMFAGLDDGERTLEQEAVVDCTHSTAEPDPERFHQHAP